MQVSLKNITAIVSSLGLHFGLFSLLLLRTVATIPDRTIKLRVYSAPVDPPLVKAEPLPLPAKPLPPPTPKAKKVAQAKKNLTKPNPKKTQPVQGFSAAAVGSGGQGIAVPLGNTLMTEDEGKRLKAEDIAPLPEQDLSSDAQLIRISVTIPQYTEEALSAALEGIFKVEVLVAVDGSVKDVALKKRIGYGMDQRVEKAAREARFTPRKDRFGRSVEGWTEMTFRLEIP